MRRFEVDEPVASVLVEHQCRVLATDGGVLQDEVAATISPEYVHRGASNVQQLNDFPALANSKRGIWIGWLHRPAWNLDWGEITLLGARGAFFGRRRLF